MVVVRACDTRITMSLLEEPAIRQPRVGSVLQGQVLLVFSSSCLPTSSSPTSPPTSLSPSVAASSLSSPLCSLSLLWVIRVFIVALCFQHLVQHLFAHWPVCLWIYACLGVVCHNLGIGHFLLPLRLEVHRTACNDVAIGTVDRRLWATLLLVVLPWVPAF